VAEKITLLQKAAKKIKIKDWSIYNTHRGKKDSKYGKQDSLADAV